MPANKNALIRYRYLDELLSSRVKYYTRQELTDKLNEHLSKSVSKKCSVSRSSPRQSTEDKRRGK